MGTEDGSDQRIYSVGAAVEFARTNNLLGIFVDADLLVTSLFFVLVPCLQRRYIDTSPVTDQRHQERRPSGRYSWSVRKVRGIDHDI